MSDSGSLPSWANPACSRLGEQEKVWTHFQPLLEARGYMLRPRYRPGWFLPPTTSPQVSETAIPARGTGEVLDATRISDGAPVVLKIVQTVSSDTEISGFLTNEPGAEAHTLPTLDLVPMDDEWSFMVMPRMRGCAHPPFKTVREVTEFVEQVLEGLVYLHNKNIAHRDICTSNIVMDTTNMIPNGFHFILQNTSDGQHRLRQYVDDDDDTRQEPEWYPSQLRQYTRDPSDPHLRKSRTQAGPMQYYYIDFGLSVRFPSREARELVTGDCGRLRKHVPEISETVPYDPFKVDIRLVGEMLRSEFMVEYDGLEFLVPFVRRLRRRNPAKRPDAAEALALFQHQVSTMSAKELARPINTDLCGWGEQSRRVILFMKQLIFH